MLWRSLSILVLCIVTSACGFQPIYSTKQGGDSLAFELAAIEISTSDEILNTQLKTTLEDLLNPTAQIVPKKYQLTLSLTHSKGAFAIEQNRPVTRYNIHVNLSYQLFDSSTKELIEGGTIQRQGSFDAVESDFATYASEKDVRRNLVQEIAQDLKLELAATLAK